MSVRIPVVISQSDRRAGASADFEERLITQLMFESGLDTTLIADLKSIDLNTTDHLCIEGLKGDFALATWESPHYVREHLQRLGIQSLVLVPVDGRDRWEWIEPGVHPKKIFLVSLSLQTPIDQTIRQLQELRESRSIPIVSLRLQPTIAPKPAVSHPIVQLQSRVGPKKPGNLDEKQNSDSIPANQPFEALSGNADDDAVEFPELDGLMDDLDKFEI